MKKIYQTPALSVYALPTRPQIVTYSLGEEDFKDEWDEEDTGSNVG